MDAVTEHRYIRQALEERWGPVRKVRVMVEILRAYVRARVLLGRREFPVVLAGLRDLPNTSKASELDQQLLGVRLGRAIERTLGPLPTDSRCLIKSLVLTRLLANRGIRGEFIIGVRWDPNFQAHAWVEKAGIALLDDGGGSYERLAEL